MSYSKKNLFKSLAVFIFTLAVSALVIWFVFLDLLESNKDKYEDNRRKLLEAEQKADLKNELKAEFEKVSDEADEITGAFLSQNDTLAFIEGIEALATATQAEYQVKVAQEVRDPDTGNVLSVNFNVALTGNFGGLVQFLRGIKEDLPYLTQITSISVERSDPDVLETAVTIKVFMK
ncbi:MAG: hypothetical protein A2919_00355 [Candidatus Spechtbacteria bacterium RIFCSPLOWO2_01_FULL_43_12]|uniref:Pilus assembly protein PilO n=1 Tax=Candidatus Spechtbacteria bacterium RIFCSPLOWO2_01_FULL_43_12 TaxID=1802162 RepID=A0A1G2HFD6_9BACT|nr:MAG: hypothetical protein A2919_00355 [Candidatus Spechtbacteria bacterium RIFCSPLOWO2_01_FULL_43_12]